MLSFAGICHSLLSGGVGPPTPQQGTTAGHYSRTKQQCTTAEHYSNWRATCRRINKDALADHDPSLIPAHWVGAWTAMESRWGGQRRMPAWVTTPEVAVATDSTCALKTQPKPADTTRRQAATHRKRLCLLQCQLWEARPTQQQPRTQLYHQRSQTVTEGPVAGQTAAWNVQAAGMSQRHGTPRPCQALYPDKL
jgi:hypothetical protein